MLPEVIFRQWLEEAKIKDWARDIGAEQVAAAQSLFQQLSPLALEEIRGRLAESDEKTNRILAWWLLDAALDQGQDSAETARNCVRWADLVAQYGNSLENRGDALEAHCDFYRGVLCHQSGELREAQLSYAKAEDNYRRAKANITLQGLAIYAQGAVALESDDVEGVRNQYGGARELFEKATALCGDEHGETVPHQIQEVIRTSLQQWQFMDELVKSYQPDLTLKHNSSLVDKQLVRMLEARMRNLAVDGYPAAETLRVARLAEEIGSRVGEVVNCTDQLLGYYWNSKHLDAAEVVLQEMIALSTDNYELKKTLVNALYLQGKYLEMRELIKEMMAEQADKAELHGLLSVAHLSLGDKAGAELHARRAHELDPDESNAALTLQQLEEDKLVTAKPKATVRFTDGTLTVDPGFAKLAPEERAALMTAAILADRPGEIATHLEQMAQTDPDLTRRVVSILQNNGILPPPELPPALGHYEKAEQLFSLALWQEAMQEYQEAIACDPGFAKAYMGLGDVFYRTGQYHLAIVHFKESIAIEPDPYTYRFLGDAYRRVGKREQALEAYRLGLELKPDYAGARQSLQELLADGGQEDEPVPEVVDAPLSENATEPSSSPPGGRALSGPAGRMASSPVEKEAKKLRLSNFKQINEQRQPGATDALIEKVAERYPPIKEILAAQTVEEQLALIQPPITQEKFEQLYFFLTPIKFFYKEKDRRLPEALRLAQLGYALAQKLPEEWNPASPLGHGPARHIADALQDLGAIYVELGELSKALGLYLDAERWYGRDAQERRQRGLMLENDFDRIALRVNARANLFGHMSSLYRTLEDEKKSSEYNRRKFEIEEQSTTVESRIEVLLRSGNGADARGNYDGAIEAYRQALDLALADSGSQVTARNVVVACHYLGDLLGRMRLHLQALQYHQKALELNRQAGHLDRMSYDHRDLGKIFEVRPDLGDALEQYEAALACASERGEENVIFSWRGSDGTWWRVLEPDSAWPSVLAAARVCIQREVFTQADAFLALAIELGEGMRSNVMQEEYRIQFQGNRLDAYQSMIKMHARIALQAPGEEAKRHVARAWEYVERAKSRAFLDSLGTSFLRPPDEIPLAWQNEETRLLESHDSLSAVHLGESAEKRRSSWDEYERVRSLLVQLWKQMAEIGPEAADYVSLRRGQPIQFQTLLQLLAP